MRARWDSGSPRVQQTYLVGDIWAGIADVATHLAHDSNVLVTVEQRVLFLSLCAGSAIVATTTAAGKDGLVGLETGVGEHDDQSLGVLVGRGNGDMLLCDELRQGWRREGLRS